MGLQCDMCCVVASIGSDGLLGTEALQSCLPHQLDLRTGQLWAEGWSTLQLHQQKPTTDVIGLLLTAVVLPPDSEGVASFSINGGQLGTCALIDPNRDLTEEFGVVVGHTLVDASTPSANILIINPNAEEVSAEISNGNPIGVYRGKIVSGATGRPIVRNFRHWRRRGRPEIPRDQPVPVFQNLDRGMRPAKDIQSVPRGNRNARTWGVQKPIVTFLSALAENFIPRKTSKKRPTQQAPTDNDLDRSLAKNGSIKIETPRDSIECEIATIGTACPTVVGKPVAMADVAESSGPAGTGASGPVAAGTQFPAVADRTGASGPRGSETGSLVVTGTRFRPDTDVTEASGPAGAGGSVMTGTRFRTVNDVAGASGPATTGAGGSVGTGKGFRTVSGVAGASGPAGTGAGGPVIAGTRFLAVLADVYAPFEETEGGPQGDIGRVDHISKMPIEVTSSHPLEHSGVAGGTVVSNEIKWRINPESCEKYTDPDAIRETSDIELMGYSSHNGSPNEGSEPFNTDGTEDTEDGDAIMVGVVGSAAPWFLTGWTDDV